MIDQRTNFFIPRNFRRVFITINIVQVRIIPSKIHKIMMCTSIIEIMSHHGEHDFDKNLYISYIYEALHINTQYESTGIILIAFTDSTQVTLEDVDTGPGQRAVKN